MVITGHIEAWQQPFASIQGYIVPPGQGMPSPTGPQNMAKAWSGSTGGLIAVEEVTLEPGQPGPRRHYHTNHASLFYILAGELLLQIGDQVTHATAGTFAFCPIGCVHTFRVVGTQAVRLLIMALPPAPAEGYFLELMQRGPEATEEDWLRLTEKWGMVIVGPSLEGE